MRPEWFRRPALLHDRPSEIYDDVENFFTLFAATALAEIVGCWLPYVWLRQQGSPWLLLPAVAELGAVCLAAHAAPDLIASGRAHAAYGGVYISMALLWLWAVDGITAANHRLDRRSAVFERHGGDYAGRALIIVQTAFFQTAFSDGCRLKT